MRVPIFLFNGILEAGKTSFIESLLKKPAFADGNTTLLFVCEEGVEEYDETLLEKNHIVLVSVGEQEELTQAFLEELAKEYQPQRVVIEFNGMWNLGKLFDVKLPKGWFPFQSLVLVNADTFNLYINNMRSIMMEHFKSAHLVILNRCNEETNISLLRGSVKSVNNAAKLFMVTEDFQMEPIKDELPYDVTADVIEISDEHYGIWYIDLWDEPEKYIGKKVKLRGLFFKQPSDPKDCFNFGRFAMPCCEEDISFMGLYCHNIGKPRFNNKDSIELLAEIRWENEVVYEGKGPVLYVKNIKACDKAQTDWVVFN